MSAYKWRTGFYKTDADVAGKEFERIYKKYDGLYPEDIVEESRPKDAVLHNEFEWRDDIAAEKYRKTQAQKMIHCLICVTETEPSSRVYYTLTRDVSKKNKYEPITVILESEDKKERLLKMALMELKAFRKKYDMLGELTGLMEVIEQIAEEYAS